jgi:hypothetical protein
MNVFFQAADGREQSIGNFTAPGKKRTTSFGKRSVRRKTRAQPCARSQRDFGKPVHATILQNGRQDQSADAQAKRHQRKGREGTRGLPSACRCSSRLCSSVRSSAFKRLASKSGIVFASTLASHRACSTANNAACNCPQAQVSSQILIRIVGDGQDRRCWRRGRGIGLFTTAVCAPGRS